MDISHSIKARDRSGRKLQLCKVDQVRLVGKRETSRNELKGRPKSLGITASGF
jgi:hypothetical protein